MSETQPYVFGDVLNGHRWTPFGWVALEQDELAVVGATHEAAVRSEVVVDEHSAGDAPGDDVTVALSPEAVPRFDTSPEEDAPEVVDLRTGAHEAREPVTVLPAPPAGWYPGTVPSAPGASS